MIPSNKSNVKQWEQPTSIWNPMFISLFIANLTLILGQQMGNSLLSLYANSLGAPADEIGQLMSMFAITALIFRFISGPAMNSFDKKKLVAMAMCFMAVAYVGYACAAPISTFLGMEVITVMKGFRLIQGVGNAFGNACCLAMVPDVLPKDKFATGMGYYSCAQVVAQAIAPTLAVYLRDWFGYVVTYVIIFGVAIATMLLSLQVKLAPHQKVPFRLKLNNMVAKEAFVPAAITFLLNMGYTAISSFLLVYAEERGIAGGSWFFTLYALTMLVTRPAVGKLTEKYGFAKVGVPSVLAMAASLTLIGYANNTVTLLLAALVNAFGFGAVQPMLQSLCIRSVTPDRRGSASGTNYIAMDTANLLGPTVCGAVAAQLGYTPVMWLVMMVPVLISALAIIVFRKRITEIETNYH